MNPAVTPGTEEQHVNGCCWLLSRRPAATLSSGNHSLVWSGLEHESLLVPSTEPPEGNEIEATTVAFWESPVTYPRCHSLHGRPADTCLVCKFLRPRSRGGGGERWRAARPRGKATSVGWTRARAQSPVVNIC